MRSYSRTSTYRQPYRRTTGMDTDSGWSCRHSSVRWDWTLRSGVPTERKGKGSSIADHLFNVFHPYSGTASEAVGDHLTTSVKSERWIVSGAQEAHDKRLNRGKTPEWPSPPERYSPPKCLRYISILFCSIVALEYIPNNWRTAEIIRVPKPCKEPDLLTSYGWLP